MRRSAQKIGCGVRENKTAHKNGLKEFPKIILQGNWLEKEGFKIGEYVKIEARNGAILLSKMEEGEAYD